MAATVATLISATLVLKFAMMISPPNEIYSNTVGADRHRVGSGEFHVLDGAGRPDAVIEAGAVGIGPSEHGAGHARRADVEALLGCSREQHHRTDKSGRGQERFDCGGHLQPPVPSCNVRDGGDISWLTKSLNCNVRKPEMSEEIGGLYVGLALRRVIKTMFGRDRRAVIAGALPKILPLRSSRISRRRWRRTVPQKSKWPGQARP